MCLNFCKNLFAVEKQGKVIKKAILSANGSYYLCLYIIFASFYKDNH